MRIERIMQHEITPADVYAMSITHAYQERKCLDAGALSWHIDIAVDGDTAVVKTRRKLPTVGFPSLLRKVVPSGVVSTETISWGAAAADGRRTAGLHVDFHGAPAHMGGEIRLEPVSELASRLVVEAEFTAQIPLVGGKIEKLAAPIILGVIDSEERTGRAWVADPS